MNRCNDIENMHKLKKTCNLLIENQLKVVVIEDEKTLDLGKNKERYAPGMASFKEMYNQLAKIPLDSTPSRAEALLAVLHVASEHKMRLIPQKDMDDFKIRKVTDFNEK